MSIDAHCTVLSRLVAFTCSVTARVAAEPHVAGQRAVQLTRARADDHVARRIAERARRRDRERRGVEELVDRRVAQLNRRRRCSRRAASRWCRAATSLAAPITRAVNGVPDCSVRFTDCRPVADDRRQPAAVLQPAAVGTERQLDEKSPETWCRRSKLDSAHSDARS